MVTKIYALVWFLVAMTAGYLYYSEGFSELTTTVFGFIAGLLLAIGLVAILPWWVDKQYTWRYESGD